MKVLVTGGSGWIGRAVVRQLELRDHEAIVFDRSDDTDVRNFAQVASHVDDVDHVIHLAGLLGTHELLERADEAVSINVLGGLNVVRACSRSGVGLTEITMPRVNPSIYAATKACAMDIAEAFRDAGMLRASYVRAYNAYGAGQAYGGDHPQKIVPTFASKAWAGEPLPIWGDGILLCDLIHVDDVARMLVDAMPYGDGQVFDAGTGVPWTVRWVARRVIELTGGESDVVHLPPRPNERRFSTGDDYAHGENWSLLDWQPQWDDIRFAEAVESYKP